MDQRPAPRPRPTALALAAGLVIALAACSSGGGAPATAAPTIFSAAPASAAVSSPSPTAGASPAGPVTAAMGAFHAVDGRATGTAALIHLANGSFEVSFEDFSTAGIAHTNVVLVSNVDVAKTTEVDQKALLDLGPLKATTGMQEFAVPAGMTADAMGYHTVLLWDTEMLHAIAAAPLKP